MSLFKLRQFWCTTSEDDEYFDHNSLIVTRLNSDFDYIVTASQSGVLRILDAHFQNTEEVAGEHFNANDVIVEKIFDAPILQVGCGKLVSGQQVRHLAVLHPLLLSIYSLVIKPGKTSHGNQSYLELVYEHKLRKCAYNFVVGPFGSSESRDFICVQSLDGVLTFFEQESQASYIALPDFLLPGPLSYVPKTDSFITCNSDWNIVSYKYKSLADASDDIIDPIYSKPKVSADWLYNLGEAALDVTIIDDVINNETWIMVLGEKNLFSLNDRGRLRFMKKLDYSPVCFHCYVIDTNIYTLVVSDSSMLLIYQGTTLKWSTRLDFLPISICRVFLKTIKGALVLLGEEGRLECGYLGTEPSLFVAPPLNLQELDYEKVEKELHDLEGLIKNSSKDVAVQGNVEKELTVNVIINNDIEICTFEQNLQNAANNYMCSVIVEIQPQGSFQETQVALFVQTPLKIVPNNMFYSNLSEKVTLTCYVFLDESLEVPTLSLEVKLSVISSLGVPRTITKTALLPISLILEPCSCEKENTHKLTLSTNDAPVSLQTLFSEFSHEDISSNSIAFKNAPGDTATILLGKSSERYRIQSNSLTTMSVLVEQLTSRLKNYYKNNSTYRISFISSLPLVEIFEFVKEHYSTRQMVNDIQKKLAKLSAQFRLIQKRLIVKYRSKNPTPLKNLELLLNDTYSDIIFVTEFLENAKGKLVKTQTNLSCVIYLARQLIDLMDINSGVTEMVKSTFCGRIYDLDSQAWEDVMDTCLCYLLRTVLAKNEKDQLRVAHTSFEEVKDMNKFEKHLTQVLERLQKKSIFNDGSEAEKDDEQEEEEAKYKLEAPIGSEIAVSSTRLLSARKSLLRKRHKDDVVASNQN
ncbi:hypothetical protein GWI33_009051 [Rhynchophorus ferrugineus]|uniref:Protein PTHB1 n=1 Tax=Rhynchophorus ferrugineus TaxID=354439 RepID=A0A834MFH7_RHYFE|nr:hypothetical protein GWI33_009051 [Rhynchophorus ferrugineus]